MVKFSMFSDSGTRPNNEDNIGMYEDGENYCFVLADGLGGHGKGEVASQIAVDSSILKYVEMEDRRDFLKEAFESAQATITRYQNEERSCMDMKTTMVALVVQEDSVRWGHIGDSRLYYFQRGRLKERTLDHSVPQMLVSVGRLKEREIRHHPDRNRLLRVLGIEMDEVNYQESEPVARTGQQAFLLCSDGFWELIEEKKMEALLKKAESPEHWVRLMQEVILKNGKNTDMDNYSAIAVWL
ncbi:MAG: serine/threonine-protein phosphatase [Lachnospiraceae bacterium]|jgi:serine/threonine protein phosphatase PrpC|nr:serine/threonine-protein phosphatase [Lachnospiraceae bacterium]